jgi:hypothetical protein
VALGAGDDEALKGGVVALAIERGLSVLAHSPLGGPKRAPRLGRDRLLAEIAERHGATAAQVILAGLLSLDARVVALPARRAPKTRVSPPRPGAWCSTTPIAPASASVSAVWTRRAPRPPAATGRWCWSPASPAPASRRTWCASPAPASRASTATRAAARSPASPPRSTSSSQAARAAWC